MSVLSVHKKKFVGTRARAEKAYKRRGSTFALAGIGAAMLASIVSISRKNLVAKPA